MTNYSLAFAVLEITRRCNLHCPFCFSDSGKARCDELTFDEWRCVIDDLKLLGCGNCEIIGGEFMFRRDWYEIASRVRESGIELQIVTNGLMVDECVRAQLRSLDLQAIGVSLDGATPESYRSVRGVDGFGKVRKLLDDLARDGFRQVSVLTTFNARTLDDFDRFVEMFVDTPFSWEVHMALKMTERFPDELVFSKEQYALFVEKVTRALSDLRGRLKLGVRDDFGYFPMTPKLRFLCDRWNGCQAGKRTVAVLSNGDVAPCSMLGDRFIEDNLRRRPLAEIWNDPNSFAQFRRKEEHLTGACAKCPFGSRCKAGCSAMALSQTGTLTETPFCIRQLETERIIKEMTA